MGVADERAWFRWRHYHPRLAEDPRAAFYAGVVYGKAAMLDASAEWSQLAPLLGSVLEELVALREERDVARAVTESDRRPAF